jgi:hypothetical protein
LWLTLIALWAFYCRTWLGYVAGSGAGVAVTTLLFSVIGPETTGPSSFTGLSPWPWLLVGAYVLVASVGVSTLRQAAGAVGMVVGLWAFLPQTGMADFRNSITLHVLWGALIAIGFANQDAVARALRGLSATLFPIAALTAVASPVTADLPVAWKAAYVAALAIICGLIAWSLRSRAYRLALTAIGVAAAYELAAYGYRGSSSIFGRAAATSFLWSLALLLTGLLISAHKAGWIVDPRRRQTTESGESPSESGQQH